MELKGIISSHFLEFSVCLPPHFDRFIFSVIGDCWTEFLISCIPPSWSISLTLSLRENGWQNRNRVTNIIQSHSILSMSEHFVIRPYSNKAGQCLLETKRALYLVLFFKKVVFTIIFKIPKRKAVSDNRVLERHNK